MHRCSPAVWAAVGLGAAGRAGLAGGAPPAGKVLHTARFGHLCPQFGRWERLLPGLCTSCVPPSSLPSCRHALGTWNNPFCSPRTPTKVQLQAIAEENNASCAFYAPLMNHPAAQWDDTVGTTIFIVNLTSTGDGQGVDSSKDE